MFRRCVLDLSENVDWGCDDNSISFDLKRFSFVAGVAFYHYVIIISIILIECVDDLFDCMVEVNFIVKDNIAIPASVVFFGESFWQPRHSTFDAVHVF